MNGLILSEHRPDAVCGICREGFTDDAFTNTPQDREKQAVSHFIENKQANHDPFHQGCIQEWMGRSLECPYDRLPIYHSYVNNPHFNWIAPLTAAAKQAIFAASLTLALGVIPVLARETIEFRNEPEISSLSPNNTVFSGMYIASMIGIAASSLITGLTGNTLWTSVRDLSGIPGAVCTVAQGIDLGTIASDAIEFGLSGTQHRFYRSTPYAIAGIAMAPITQCANWIFNRTGFPEIGRYNIVNGIALGLVSTLPLLTTVNSTAEWFVFAVTASGISAGLISLKGHFNTD